MKKGTKRIWLRKDKARSNGQMPLCIVYSKENKRQFYNTGMNIYPEQWDDENAKVMALSPKYAKPYGLKVIDLPTKEEATKINQKLTALLSEIDKIETRFDMDNVAFNSEMVMTSLKDALKAAQMPESAKEANPNELHNFMDRYIRDNEATRKEGSLQVYRSVKKRIEAYEKHKSRVVTFDNIDYAFFDSFKSFLFTVCKLNSTTVAKQLSTVKTFLNYASKYGHEVSTNYKTFKIQRDPLEVIALTQFEFDTLCEMDLSEKPRLRAIRDVFVFSCCTGMRFSDLEQLTWEQIKKDKHGNQYIEQTVQKTKAKLKIPLNRKARQILAYYDNYPRPLPIVSNQKSNDFLHELCALAGFDEPIEIVRFQGSKRIVNTHPKHELITMHAGRKSFCTLSLEKGMSAEQVMSISGHKDYKSFKRYVNITDETASVALRMAWD